MFAPNCCLELHSLGVQGFGINVVKEFSHHGYICDARTVHDVLQLIVLDDTSQQCGFIVMVPGQVDKSLDDHVPSGEAVISRFGGTPIIFSDV